jgi:alpha-L-fucosidase
MNKIPYFLKNYADIYNENPREATKKWLADAKYGLFLHYGLFSMGDEFGEKKIQEWCQYSNVIPVKEYEKLKDKFTAENFDADYIVSFAKECGMKYINITTRHHDSFCLWDTEYTEFNSINSPAKRDLLSELYEACKKQDIGLLLYYSHGRDWRHPHAPNNDEWGGSARPLYDPLETSYAYGEEHDLNIYLEFMKNQIKEIAEKFPDIIGFWLDGVAVPMSGDTDKFKIQELYDFIHDLAPHLLVSYKQGVLGTEDFFTPEHYVPKKVDDNNEMTQEYQKNASRLGKIGEQPDKLIEVNTTMIHDPVSWGYTKIGTHFTEKEVYDKILSARAINANFVMNTGVMPDGGIDPIDDKTLRLVGKMLKQNNILSKV